MAWWLLNFEHLEMAPDINIYKTYNNQFMTIDTKLGTLQLVPMIYQPKCTCPLNIHMATAQPS
jgi:hypothetical protein